MAEYLLPDVGEGLTEAEIVSWKVKVGDEVAINDIVVEIETAKSLVELPSPYAGTVTALLVPEGETVAVGTPIIAIGDAADATATAPQTEDDPYLGMAQQAGAEERKADAAAGIGEIDLSNPAASGGGEGESLVGRMKAEGGTTRRPRRRGGYDEVGRVTAHAVVHDVYNPGVPSQHEKVSALADSLVTDAPADVAVPATSARTEAAPALVPTAATTPAAARALAKPPVRKLAKDLGVDLATLTPTGPHGTVSREDVHAAAAGPARSAAPQPMAHAGVRASVAPGERERREPIKGVRKMMGQAMVDSAFTIPHVTEWITVDVTETMAFVERIRARREFREVKVSPLLILARACILAMRRTPEINAVWDDAAQEVVYKSYVNLGIAAATPRGLVVPNVKDADALSLLDLAVALGELTAVAREGRTQPADMAGGTFTITNVGPFGVDGGTPIINPGESAILCFGTARRQPWVVGSGADERIEIRDVCTLALSFDHRHIDGELGSRFLADVAGIMSDPASALLF